MNQTPLPRWDISSVFPSLESEAFQDEFARVLEAITDLAALFDRYEVRRRENASDADEVFVQRVEEVLGRVNALRERLRTVGSYIHCYVTTDARNDTAKAYQSRLETQGVLLGQLNARLVAWLGSGDIEALLAASPLAREHEFFLRRAEVLAQHQMSESEENLAAALQPMALGGWAKLHGNMTALLSVTVALPENSSQSEPQNERVLPMSAVRALASSPDRAVRKAAFEAEIQAWETVALPLCAALNGIKGYQRTLRKRRGFENDVEPTLIGNSIDRETLQAMQSACVQSFPDFRRYMDAKARALNLPQLAWFDLQAPLGEANKSWSWPEATAFIVENFGRYSPELADFAAKSFREGWIDAAPRLGKIGGAYCTCIRPGESRVLMNFDGSFYDVSTLAHELGHAYHNLTLAGRTPLQLGVPSTLAETASIFCETLIFEAAVAQANASERFTLLNSALERNLMVVVDIHSRFLFEQAVFEKRASRDLTASEFCDLMTQAQRATYGEHLEPLHPYMWAVKGHYYGPTFYNYPYTFGLLFGLGLYACYQRDPERFRAQYDDLLGAAGMADAATLARRFGLDTHDIAFWNASLGIIRGQIDEFEALVAQM